MTAHPVTALPDSGRLADALRGFVPHVSTLAFVVDDTPSMRVWTPTVNAFRDLAATIFGAVNSHSLARSRGGPAGRPDGQVVLVLSDGLDAFWAQREAGALLQGWGRTAPVAMGSASLRCATASICGDRSRPTISVPAARVTSVRARSSKAS